MNSIKVEKIQLLVTSSLVLTIRDCIVFKILRLYIFYEERNQPEKANKIYDRLIDELQPSSRLIIDLYKAFKAKGKSDLSYRTLQEGRKILKKTYPLNFQFAEYYGSVGETEKMIDEYLGMIDYHPTYMSTVKRVLGAQIDFTKDFFSVSKFLIFPHCETLTCPSFTLV